MIEEKETIIRLITALFPNVKIYLFGSYARGEQRETSDIDLAFDIGRPLTTKELSRIMDIIQALNIPDKVDVVDMHRIPEDFKNVILREGIVWKD